MKPLPCTCLSISAFMHAATKEFCGAKIYIFYVFEKTNMLEKDALISNPPLFQITTGKEFYDFLPYNEVKFLLSLLNSFFLLISLMKFYRMIL